MKNLLSITALILCILAMTGCKELQEPQFKRLENVKFGSIKVDKGVSLGITADALLNNPNSVGVTISKMDFDIFVDGIKVSDMNQLVSKKMPGNSDFTLPLNFRVPLDKVFAGFRPTIRDMMSKRTVKIKMIGDIYVKPAGVEIKLPVEFEGEHAIALKDFINFKG